MNALILDDSRTDAYVATQVLQQYFGTVKACGTPAEFHAALRVEPLADLAVMDVFVGDLHNGIAELDTIRTQKNAASVIPIIVVTASSDAALHQFAIDNGASAVIVKPITKEKLEPLLAELLPNAHIVGN